MSDTIKKQADPSTAILSSSGKLEMMADLVANGEFPFPKDIPAEQYIQLVTEVGIRRRKRLVKFIARSIAREICQKDREF